MDSPVVRIDARRIVDRESFHDVFAKAFGFPAFYGRNMDAWIDCLTSLNSPSDEMTKVHAEAGGVVTLQVDHVEEFSGRFRELYDALVECAAFVNWRRVDRGMSPVLALSFSKKPKRT